MKMRCNKKRGGGYKNKSEKIWKGIGFCFLFMVDMSSIKRSIYTIIQWERENLKMLRGEEGKKYERRNVGERNALRRPIEKRKKI
jgi:hypothetical protein